MSSKRVFETSNEIFNIARKAKINPYLAFCQFYLRELVALMTQIDNSIIVYGGISTAIHAGQYNRVVSDMDFSFNGSKNDLQDFLKEVNKNDRGMVKFTGFMGKEIRSNPKMFNLNFKTKFKGQEKVIAADASLCKIKEFEQKPLPRFTSNDKATSVRTITLEEHFASKVKAMFVTLLATDILREQDVYDLMFLTEKCKLDTAVIKDKVQSKMMQEQIKEFFTHEKVNSITDRTKGILRPVTPLAQTPMTRPVVIQNAKTILKRFI